MPLSTDRDLLALAPNLFTDVAWPSQLLVSTTDAIVANALLVSATADFEAAGVDTGHVALVNETPYEVIDRLSSAGLSLSLIRATTSDPVIPGDDATAATLLVRSFRVQAEHIHNSLLRMLATDQDGVSPSSGVVMSDSTFAKLEALGTLEYVFASAAAADPTRPELAQQASVFGDRFRDALRTLSIRLDLDGDGVSDRVARPGTPLLTRI